MYRIFFAKIIIIDIIKDGGASKFVNIRAV